MKEEINGGKRESDPEMLFGIIATWKEGMRHDDSNFKRIHSNIGSIDFFTVSVCGLSFIVLFFLMLVLSGIFCPKQQETDSVSHTSYSLDSHR